MLSKVAERLYWTARYLERVENIARLVSVYDNLLFDLPRDINIGWYNLIELNSLAQTYEERYKVRDERNVVKFMLADDTNPVSMLSSLTMVRENVRTTRDVVPMETWELVNELHLYAKNNIKQGINRSGRHEFLDGIVKSCQGINGLLSGTMSHDAGWQFLSLGRDLERADMTTRILDAGATLLANAGRDRATGLPQIVWGNVLRSLSAHQNYRRTVRMSICGADVAGFLLQDPNFPRSVCFCLNQMMGAVSQLPNYQKVKHDIQNVNGNPYNIEDEQLLGEPFRNYLNDLQIQIANLHSRFSDTWFTFREAGTQQQGQTA